MRLIFIEIHPLFLKSFGTDETQIFDNIIELGYKIAEKTIREERILCTLTKISE